MVIDRYVWAVKPPNLSSLYGGHGQYEILGGIHSPGLPEPLFLQPVYQAWLLRGVLSALFFVSVTMVLLWTFGYVVLVLKQKRRNLPFRNVSENRTKIDSNF
jgi:hypothetical protein